MKDLKTILEKLPACLFMVLVMAVCMYSFYAKDNAGAITETQDYDLRGIVEEKGEVHALAEMFSEEPAIEEPAIEEPAAVETQKEDELSVKDTVKDTLKEKEPNREKENEVTVTTAQATNREVGIPENNEAEEENDNNENEEPQPAKINPDANEIRKETKTVSINIEPVSQVNVNVTFNQHVLDIIDTYAIGEGRYPYLLNNDYANYNGVTQTLTYQGKELLRAHPSGNRASHCVGITFEVFFRAMQQRNRDLGIPVDDFNGMGYDALFDFVMNWFAASGSKQNSNIAIAVEKYGIGKRLYDLEDVKPGDFIDINRQNGTGHTVVFINWIRDQNRIIGLRYWSSQPSTGGISYNKEYLNAIDHMYMVRIFPVKGPDVLI